jgi:hypothetical protein
MAAITTTGPELDQLKLVIPTDRQTDQLILIG